VLARYRDQLGELAGEGFVTTGPDRVTLTREGLLRVDSLLPRFFKPEHATLRYT
jgi:oxygen-independent coproporphyrinogen-3 oxidase